MRFIPSTIRTLLKSKAMVGGNAPCMEVVLPEKTVGTQTLPVKRIWISREEAAIAQRAVIEIENVNPDNPLDPGYFMPYRSDDFAGQSENEWKFQLVPGKRILVYLGYGTEKVLSFYGEIDDVSFEATATGYTISLDCRDLGAFLVDNLMIGPDPEEPYYVAFDTMDVSDIVGSALIAAGFAPEAFVTEPSGVLRDMEFEEQTYADLIEWAIDATGFQFYIREDGKPHFVPPKDRYPNVENEEHVCVLGQEVSLENFPVAPGTEKVKRDPLGSVVYTRDLDYTIDYATGKITPLPTGSMLPSQTFYTDYVFAAWTFRHGEDIFSLTYSLSRRNQYGKIIVEGDGAEGSWTAPESYWDTHSIPQSKVLRTINTELLEDAECTAQAVRLATNMQRRYMQVEFAAVAVPWLQVGDCIQVIEYSSTISEIYKIVSLQIEYSGSEAIMTMRCYFFGYAAIA